MAAEESDIFAIDTAFKLLTSRDTFVRSLAWEDLNDTVRHRLQLRDEDPDVAAFLSGTTDGEFRRSSNRIGNIWTAARAASRRLQVKWTIQNCLPVIEAGDFSATAVHRRNIATSIRKSCKSVRDERLLSLPNQGKTLECVAASKASTHFLQSGSYTRFADWRFVHKARLNLVSLNGAKPWSNLDPRCRRCGADRETLPHVLDHCMAYSTLYKERHNAIVDRLIKMCERDFNIISVDQSLNTSRLRPDLLVERDGQHFLIDVTIPFENHLGAFAEARARKLEKYEMLRASIAQERGHCVIVPFVIGALGSWDRANDKFINIACSRSYARLLRMLCVSDVIRHSRNIYVGHLSGRSEVTLLTEANPPNNEQSHSQANEN
ncbi:uncharacterized protein LOC118201923 [Stegodyphus dumicola]|uniref:uncharacterized protein LOC118201923 n=1 Tax=Stegodyphus dumicola TaxID=202533 RepID=UPI0015ACC795|nr:uncharacterized protein LOC118201923 [Stegodyphus dumicola]